MHVNAIPKAMPVLFGKHFVTMMMLLTKLSPTPVPKIKPNPIMIKAVELENAQITRPET